MVQIEHAQILFDHVLHGRPDTSPSRRIVLRRWGREFTVEVQPYTWITDPKDPAYLSAVVVRGVPNSTARVNGLPENPSDYEVSNAIASCLRGPGAVNGRRVL
jgi:hypothetical protein